MVSKFSPLIKFYIIKSTHNPSNKYFGEMFNISQDDLAYCDINLTNAFITLVLIVFIGSL